MTGSTNKLFAHLNHTLGTRERVIKSPVQKTHDEGIMETVLYLRGQVKIGDIGSMLADERLILTHSLKFDANSAEEKNSLKSAIAQLDESRRCFDALANNPASYKDNEATYPTKKKKLACRWMQPGIFLKATARALQIFYLVRPPTLKSCWLLNAKIICKSSKTPMWNSSGKPWVWKRPKKIKVSAAEQLLAGQMQNPAMRGVFHSRV